MFKCGVNNTGFNSHRIEAGLISTMGNAMGLNVGYAIHYGPAEKKSEFQKIKQLTAFSVHK